MKYIKICHIGLPHWIGENIDLIASIEPSGIQILGEMPESIWKDWYKNLTKVLGDEIGEPEEGFCFKYWEPFIKEYSNIKSINKKEIVFEDYAVFRFEGFESYERGNENYRTCGHISKSVDTDFRR